MEAIAITVSAAMVLLIIGNTIYTFIKGYHEFKRHDDAENKS